MSKRFMHVSIAFLCLALAYHFGARNVGAQAPANPVVGVASLGNGANVWVALTADGDSYHSGDTGLNWQRTGNVFGGPTSVEKASLGEMKARWR